MHLSLSKSSTGSVTHMCNLGRILDQEQCERSSSSERGTKDLHHILHCLYLLNDMIKIRNERHVFHLLCIVSQMIFIRMVFLRLSIHIAIDSTVVHDSGVVGLVDRWVQARAPRTVLQIYIFNMDTFFGRHMSGSFFPQHHNTFCTTLHLHITICKDDRLRITMCVHARASWCIFDT